MLNDGSESLIPDLVPENPKISKGLHTCKDTNIARTSIKTYRHNSRVVAVEPDSVSRVGRVEFSL